MRSSGAAPGEAHPVAPEPQTSGQIAAGPDAPEKQQSATTTGDAPTAEPAPPTADEARGAERIVAKPRRDRAAAPKEVVTRHPAADEATRAAADRAAPGADLAQTPPSDDDAAAAARGEAQIATPDATSTGTTVARPETSETHVEGGRGGATATSDETPTAAVVVDAGAGGGAEATGPVAAEAGAVSGAAPAEPNTGTPGRPPARERGDGGEPDDLTKISGIGAKTQKSLNALGLWRYEHLAALSPAEVGVAVGEPRDQGPH